MSAEDLVYAVQKGDFPEVVRLVDEEHVDVDSKDFVSFPFLKRNFNGFILTQSLLLLE